MHDGSYPREFQTGVSLIRSAGRTVAQIARALGIKGDTLRQWVRQEKDDLGGRTYRPTTEGLVELEGPARGERRTRSSRLPAPSYQGVSRRSGDGSEVRYRASGSLRVEPIPL